MPFVKLTDTAVKPIGQCCSKGTMALGTQPFLVALKDASDWDTQAFLYSESEAFPEMGGRASVPESLFVFCSSTSCSNVGNHASLNLCLSVRDRIYEVPGDCMQEISALFLDTVRLLKFFCKNLLCTVYIGAS